MTIQHDILSTLAYFDLFYYPLTKEEIFLFLPNSCSPGAFDAALDLLTDESAVATDGEFYQLHADPEQIRRRKRGNQKAAQLMKTALRAARFLSCFPFVRGVGISGSLSKQYADEESDIDFFIITKEDRLWISRTLLHAFKKLTFLVNRQHFFCMNYFIDEEALEIKEKNLYTATETVTLIPCSGAAAFQRFYAANGWTGRFLPQQFPSACQAGQDNHNRIKQLAEALFNNPFGDRLDRFLMRLTAARWKTKTLRQKRNKRGVLMSMLAGRHFAKPFPAFYQEKLMQSYTLKCAAVTGAYENALAAHFTNP